VCTPLTVDQYNCVCLPGNFRQMPPFVGDYTVDYPQCVDDRCAVNNGGCTTNAICSATGQGTSTCACAPGFLPQGVTDPTTCTPASCVSLSPGVFPLADAFSSVGTCTAKVAGERCLLGCVDGYKPVVNGRSYNSITAVCAIHNGGVVPIYTFTTFDCIVDASGHAPMGPNQHGDDSRDHDDNGDNQNNHGVIDAHSPWYCGVTPIVPARLPHLGW